MVLVSGRKPVKRLDLIEEKKMSKFVAVFSAKSDKSLAQVHRAGCSDILKGEYPTKAFATAEQARYEAEGMGGTFVSGQFVTDFPATYAPCVAKAVR
jgi:hypothetical protein